MDDQLYAFTFRGLLTEQALDGTNRELRLTHSPTVDATVARSVALDILDTEYVLRARRMATAYTAIAAFENTVRELVSKRLIDSDGLDGGKSALVKRFVRKPRVDVTRKPR